MNNVFAICECLKDSGCWMNVRVTSILFGLKIWEQLFGEHYE